MNLTDNKASGSFSGLDLRSPLDVNCHSCQFLNNKASSCMYISSGTGKVSVRCLVICNNTCRGSSNGLIRIIDSITISESAIAGNDAQYLVYSDVSCLLTFKNCHFDTLESSAGGYLRVTMVGCAADAAAFTGVTPTCETSSSDPTDESGGSQVGLIVGVIVVVLVLVAVGVVVLFKVKGWGFPCSRTSERAVDDVVDPDRGS
jgi:hypothetical protein